MASSLAAPASAPRAFVDRGARGRSRRARTPSPRASARGSRGSVARRRRARRLGSRSGRRAALGDPPARRPRGRPGGSPRADARGDAFGAEGGGYLEVEGGARLSGLARVGGAKNAVLALLAGALACREPVLLRGVPYLRDVLSMIDVLRSVGAVVHLDARGPGTVLVDASELTSDAPDPDAVRKLRASFFAAGPILGRLGSVRMPLPGGCAIGARPVDLHLAAFEALGADVEVTPDGVVIARATSRGEGGGDKNAEEANAATRTDPGSAAPAPSARGTRASAPRSTPSSRRRWRTGRRSWRTPRRSRRWWTCARCSSPRAQRSRARGRPRFASRASRRCAGADTTPSRTGSRRGRSWSPRRARARP